MARPVFPPYPPQPGGGSGGGGGGTGGGSGAPTGGGVYLPESNGQVLANNYVPFYPCLNLATGRTEYRTFDVTVPFNDPALGSNYSFKVEEIAVYRNPSVRSVLVTYLDKGPLTLSFTVTFSNDDQTVGKQTVVKQFGNTIPTFRLMAQRVDFMATGQLLQLSFVRAPNAGVMQIAKVVMAVEGEEVTE